MGSATAGWHGFVGQGMKPTIPATMNAKTESILPEPAKRASPASSARDWSILLRESGDAACGVRVCVRPGPSKNLDLLPSPDRFPSFLAFHRSPLSNLLRHVHRLPGDLSGRNMGHTHQLRVSFRSTSDRPPAPAAIRISSKTSVRCVTVEGASSGESFQGHL